MCTDASGDGGGGTPSSRKPQTAFAVFAACRPCPGTHNTWLRCQSHKQCKESVQHPIESSGGRE
eukprot:9262813-Alexandrium_andersonii.AAC.1